MSHSKIIYKDVIVIGNGPSGISLSYLLAGNWPYYTGEIHPNEYLQMRLQDGGDKSLVEQDLEFLSSGLEGRSSNPVALLFDNLTHPDADIGMENASILEWRHHTEKALDHVVLGKMPVGGAWQMMEGGMQTLSLGNWMQLPDLPFKAWLENYRKHVDSSGNSGAASARKANRASIEEVRNYYNEYVDIKGIRKYFRDNATVTTVERVLDVHHTIDDESGEQVPCSNNHCGKFKWEVRGQEVKVNDEGRETVIDFCYRAPNVVVATGTYDMPNKLKVPGEHFPYIIHSMGELEKMAKAGKVSSESHPVLVIGAGLSAADAILYAQEQDIPVVHMFRRDVDDPNIIFRNLPAMLYPEYHHVHKMMKSQEEMDNYKAFPVHHVVEFKEDNKVLIRRKKGSCDTILEVSCVLVQIGSRPELSFLPQAGRHLGLVPGMHIDSKHNPIDIDPFTYQSVHEHGLFALGPLVGDNFVRFLRGGALGITSHIHRKRCHNL